MSRLTDIRRIIANFIRLFIGVCLLIATNDILGMILGVFAVIWGIVGLLGYIYYIFNVIRWVLDIIFGTIFIVLGTILVIEESKWDMLAIFSGLGLLLIIPSLLEIILYIKEKNNGNHK